MTKKQSRVQIIAPKHDDMTKRCAFTLAEGGRSPHLKAHNGRKVAFTLAEVLITLGIIGVVAAITLPSMISNIQERVKKDQVRTVKYKLTLATDKMKSLDKIGPYDTTEEFINELKNHFKIAKVCNNSHLTDCWPTDEIVMPDETTPKKVNTIKTGADLKALALGTSKTTTMGIVTGDGTPIILVYSPVCNALDPSKTYTWSMVDNKPETNATTNCISAIFDINGAKKPNRLGSDVRTLNSIFGYKQYSATAVNKDQCEQLKKKHLVEGCSYDTDYYAGAVKKCNDIGLHLPSMETLAVIAGATYGISNVGPHTTIAATGPFTEDDFSEEALSDMIWVEGDEIPTPSSSPLGTISGYFWSSSERSATTAWGRRIYSNYSNWYYYGRNSYIVPLCVGD